MPSLLSAWEARTSTPCEARASKNSCVCGGTMSKAYATSRRGSFRRERKEETVSGRVAASTCPLDRSLYFEDQALKACTSSLPCALPVRHSCVRCQAFL